jgi:hypothetical protein
MRKVNYCNHQHIIQQNNTHDIHKFLHDLEPMCCYQRVVTTKVHKVYKLSDDAETRRILCMSCVVYYEVHFCEPTYETFL